MAPEQAYEDRNVYLFDNLMSQILRPGIKELYDYLVNETDFLTAPASTRFHGNHKGGLLAHSLNVYDCLMTMADSPTWERLLSKYTLDTFIICGLLHDLCKTNMYKISYRNVKQYSKEGSRFDKDGYYDWVQVPYYTVDGYTAFPHSEHTIEILDRFILLEEYEKYAIRWHMGFTEPKEHWNNLKAAINKYPLVLALHEADLEATYTKDKTE